MRRSIGRTVLRGAMAAMVAVASLMAGACGDDNNPTPTTPTTPIVSETVTETFSGDLKVNGAATHVFLVSRLGTVTIQLTAIDPAGSPVFGVSLGTWNGTACQVVIANDAAALNATVTGNVTAATSLCARVYDAGKLTDPLTYTITVVHP
jgi:hypothetical protein